VLIEASPAAIVGALRIGAAVLTPMAAGSLVVLVVLAAVVCRRLVPPGRSGSYIYEPRREPLRHVDEVARPTRTTMCRPGCTGAATDASATTPSCVATRGAVPSGIEKRRPPCSA
jgi:hypothetical protein